MVIDDDEDIRAVLKTIIEYEGYSVVTATEGSEALRRLRTEPSPGLILLDLRMPGMDGRTFRELQQAESKLAAIPVVVLTGDRDGPQIAKKLGVDYVAKPVDLDPLLSLVRRYCGIISEGERALRNDH
jgi:CheY-like chemotaxis protein